MPVMDQWLVANGRVLYPGASPDGEVASEMSAVYCVGRKQRLFGRRFASEKEQHQLLLKRLALPALASDPLSSAAYANEQARLVLAVAGAVALRTP